MVTTDSMRRFSLDCMHWAERCSSPSDRQTIVDVARSWLKTAEFLDYRFKKGELPDLKSKLN